MVRAATDVRQQPRRLRLGPRPDHYRSDGTAHDVVQQAMQILQLDSRQHWQLRRRRRGSRLKAIGRRCVAPGRH